MKEAARPMAFPVLKQTVPSYDLFGRSILRFIILSLSKWLIFFGGREEETCYADKTEQHNRQLLQHLCVKFQCYASRLKMLTQTPNRSTFMGSQTPTLNAELLWKVFVKCHSSNFPLLRMRHLFLGKGKITLGCFSKQNTK